MQVGTCLLYFYLLTPSLGIIKMFSLIDLALTHTLLSIITTSAGDKVHSLQVDGGLIIEWS